jgi:hypothetical protein
MTDKKSPGSEVTALTATQGGAAVETLNKGQPEMNTTASVISNTTTSSTVLNATSTPANVGECGQKGKPLCSKGPMCGDRLIPEETGMYVAPLGLSLTLRIGGRSTLVRTCIICRKLCMHCEL